MNVPPYSRRAKSALILSPDSLGAALVGAAAELAGFRVAYLNDGETPADCIRRTKPLVVLVDALDQAARDAALLGPALMTGASIVFYGRGDQLRDVYLTTGLAGAERIAFPDELARLPIVLGAIALRRAGRARSE